MASASITNYVLSDSLPKDAAGQRFLALVNSQSSALGFLLLRGIGASDLGGAGYLTGHLAVGTHVGGSPVNSLGPGVTNLGVYLESPGASLLTVTNSGKYAHQGINRHRELWANNAPRNTSLVTAGSRDTVGLSPITLFAFMAAGAGVTAGDTVTISDENTTRITHVFSGANDSKLYELPGGLNMSSSLRIDRSISGGAASVTVFYL